MDTQELKSQSTPTTTKGKCLSDPNLLRDNEDMPLATVNLRAKRKRGVSFTSELETFKDEIKEELKELFSLWMKQHDIKLGQISTTLGDIQKTNSGIEASISYLNTQYEEIKDKVRKLEGEKKKEQEHIQILEEKIEDLQRNSRKASLELRIASNIKTENKEELIKLLLNLAKSTNIEINKSDIRDIYRIKGNQKNSQIIIELSSVSLKTDLLKATKLFNRKNKNNKLNASHLGYEKDSSPIFLVEQLTAKANRLYFLARGLVKTKPYTFCWTANGKVFVRKDEKSPIIRITNEDQIQKLGNDA